MTALIAIEGRPWAEFGKYQKPITQNQLARLLEPYEIKPKNVRLADGHVPKGYERAQFVESWDIYLNKEPSEPAPSDPSTTDSNRYTATNHVNHVDSMGNDVADALKNETSFSQPLQVSTNTGAECSGVAVQSQEEAGKEGVKRRRWTT